MTEPDKPTKAQDEPEVIKDLDVDERSGDDLRGGQSAGATRPGGASHGPAVQQA